MIEDTIRQYVITSAHLTAAPSNDERLVERGFVPSVRLLDLVGFLEDTFAIRLRSADLVPEKLATITQIASVVRTRLQKR